jgi:ATP-dependent DNA helicase RecQ
LFEALRRRRKEIADELDLPPYVIFHDATLMQLAEHRPTTEAAMLGINGVGAVKLERYGKAFLEIIAAE